MATAQDSTVQLLSGSNMYTIFYHLSDSAWPLQYGKGNLNYYGCGILSSAEALFYYKGSYWDPGTLLNYIESKYGNRNAFYVSGSGTSMGTLIPKVFGSLGLSHESLGTNINSAVLHLKLGHMVIMSCTNPKSWPGGHRLAWTGGPNSGHIVLLSGITSGGLIYCHNCSHPDIIAEQYTPEEVKSLTRNGFWAVWNPNTDIETLNNLAKRANKTGYVSGVNNSGGASTEGTSGSSSGGSGGSVTNSSSNILRHGVTHTITHYDYKTECLTKTITYTLDLIFYAEQTQDLSNTSLLSYPNLVETPFVLILMGLYTFGTYKQNGTTIKKGALAGNNASSVEYPNYISSMTVKKINGEVNTYTIELVHKIEAGADPNIIDKILSTVGYGGKVYISYGDYNEPSFSYKLEEAILLKSTSQVDFKSSRITYLLTCTSNATVLYSRLFSFSAVKAKPSDIIKNILLNSNNTYGLYDVFPKMKDKTFRNSCIASDDLAVDIPARNSMDPLSYLNMLVTYMCSTTNNTSNALKDSTYKLCLYDSTFDEENTSASSGNTNTGAYFKVVKISTTDDNKTLSTSNIYEVDIGYPSTGNVMNFQINEDQSWSMLYKYAGDIKETVYNINSEGNLTSEYIPKLVMSTSLNKMTEAQKTWWTNMTAFPIKATLTLKGLVTPVLLMDYVRVNALFYGQRHVASGLYVITSQTDSISSSGYRTTLELLRISGDNSYIKKVTVTKLVLIPVTVVGSSSTSSLTSSATSAYSNTINVTHGALAGNNDYSYELELKDIEVVNPSESQQEFISSIAAAVKKHAASYNIRVHSPIIAQSILESGWGKSKLSAYHNYFGMKCGSSWTGASVNMKTKEEYTVGTLTDISANFRVFKTRADGILGYFNFLNYDRYKNLKGITDPLKYLETIKADGYATDSQYVSKNMTIIKKYNLTLYDPKT